MKSLQKIISMLLLTLALGSQNAMQANILDLLEKYSDIPDLLPLEIKCKIAGYCSKSHMLKYLFQQTRENQDPNLQIRDIKFSSDGNAIVTILSEGGRKIRFIGKLWTKKAVQFAFSQFLTLDNVYYQRISDILFSPDGNIIVLKLENDIYNLWTKQDGKFVRQRYFEGRYNPICKITLSSDGNAFAFKLSVDTYEFWAKQDGKFVFQPPHTPNAQITNNGSSHSESKSIYFSSDGNTICLQLDNDTCELWAKKNGQFAFSQLLIPNNTNTKIVCITLSPDGSAISLLLQEDFIYTSELWIKQQDGQITNQLPYTHNAQIRYINFRHDGNTIILKLANHTWELWTKQDGQFAYYQTITPITNIPYTRDWNIYLSPDGNTIVFSLKDNNNNYTCEAWTKQDGQFAFSQVLIPHTLNTRIIGTYISPEINTIGLRLANDIWELWTKQDGQFVFSQILTPHTPNTRIWHIKFSSDENTIVLNLTDNNNNHTCEAWTKQDGQIAFYKFLIPNNPNAEIYRITFSLDGSAVNLQLKDDTTGIKSKYTCELWTKQDGKFACQSPHTPNTNVYRIEFSPYGNFIALGLFDCTWEIWENGTKKLREEHLPPDQYLFIKLLYAMKKENLPTSLALVAHYCQKQGLNITLKELEDIFYSFEEEERTYLERLFNIVEPKLYRKLAKLDPDLTEEKIRFIQLLRGYKILMASIQLQKVSLGEFVSYYLNHHFEKQIVLNKSISIYYNLCILNIYKSFSEEARQFLKSKYGLHEQSSLVSHTDQSPSPFCSIS